MESVRCPRVAPSAGPGLGAARSRGVTRQQARQEDAGVAQPRGFWSLLALLSVCVVSQISVPVPGTALFQSLGNRRWVAQRYQDC